MPEQPPAPDPATTNNQGALDQKALIEQIMGEVNKGLNAFDKKLNKLSEQLQQNPKPVDPAPVTEPISQEPPKLELKSQADQNAAIQRLTRQIELLTEENAKKEKATKEAEAKTLESDRVNAFRSSIEGIEFAGPKEKDTFTRAYLPGLIRDDEGNFVVQTDKGPMAPAEYFKAEAESQLGFLRPAGHSGAGATGGKKAFAGAKRDVTTMSQADIRAIPEAERMQMLSEAFASISQP